MPEIKNTFLGGKMNKDLDERLLPKNQMRDALNIEVSTSQGDDVGSLQNSWGNTAHSNLSNVIPGAKCIGSLVDKESDKLYWFIKGDSSDAIVEYDAKLRIAEPVLVDFGMPATYTQAFGSADVNPNSSLLNVIDKEDISNNLSWSNGVPNSVFIEGISWDLTAFSAAAISGRAGYLYLFRDEINLFKGYKYEIEYEVTVLSTQVVDSVLQLSNHSTNNSNVTLDIHTSGIKKIQWIQGVDASVLEIFHNCTDNTENTFTIKNVKIKQVDRFLNFSSVEHITAINILDGMLIWTDGHTEPKKINIERCKAGSNKVANFNATSFVGPELISNSNFVSETNWTSDTEWDIASGSMQSVMPVPQFKRFSQANVTIEQGKTYVIEVDVFGSFTSGDFSVVIVDNLGGTTEPRQGATSSVLGSVRWILTAGVTDENSFSNVDAGQTASQIYFQNISINDINAGLLIDSVSVKEIAFDWNTTTRVKNASGVYTRNVKEEDITLIKKYPLNAPKMELINTTKSKGSVIKTSCTTPTNTTQINAFLDGSGDQLRYNTFLHLYLRRDAVISRNSVDETLYGIPSIMQLDVGPDWSSIDSTVAGKDVDYPLFIVEEDALSPVETLLTPVNHSNGFTNQSNYYQKAWQTWCSLAPNSADYIWCVSENGNVETISSSILLKDFIGGRIYLNEDSSATSEADNENFWKQGQRIVIGYLDIYNNNSFWTYRDGDGALRPKPSGVSSNAQAIGVNGNVLLDDDSGDFATLDTPSQKFINSPNDFGGGWTADGNKYVGSSFISLVNTSNTNGNFLQLNVASYTSPVSPSYTDTFIYDDIDAGGQVGGNGHYAFYDNYRGPNGTANPGYGTAESINYTPYSGDFSQAVSMLIRTHSTDGVDRSSVINSLVIGDVFTYWISNDRWYQYKIVEIPATHPSGKFHFKIQFLSENVTVTESALSFSSGVNVEFRFELPGTGGLKFTSDVGDGFQYLHNFVQNLHGGRTYLVKMKALLVDDQSAVDQSAFGISAIDAATGVDIKTYKELIPKSGSQNGTIYNISYHVQIGEEDNGTGLGLSFFKRNECSVEISNVQVTDVSAAPLTIQPLVFSPKPDYISGDLVKLTNSNKAPNGDDITITVKLKEELENNSLQDKIWGRAANSYFVNADGDEVQGPSSWYDDIIAGANIIDDSDFNDDTSFAALSFAGGNTALNADSSDSADWTTSLEIVKNGTFTGNANNWQINDSTGGNGVGLELNQITTYLAGNGPNLVNLSQATQVGQYSSSTHRAKDFIRYNMNASGVDYYGDNDAFGVTAYSNGFDGFANIIPSANIASMVDGDVYVASFDLNTMHTPQSGSLHIRYIGFTNGFGLTGGQGMVNNDPTPSETGWTQATYVARNPSANTSLPPAASSIVTLSTEFTYSSTNANNYGYYGWNGTSGNSTPTSFSFGLGSSMTGSAYNISIRKKNDGTGVTLSGGSGTQWAALTLSTIQAGQNGDNGNLEIPAPGVISGNTYRISYDIVTASTGGTLSLVGATDVGTAGSDVPLPGTAIGSYSFDWVQGATNENLLLLNNNAGFDGTIGAISIKEVLIGSFGYPKYDTNNISIVGVVGNYMKSIKQLSSDNNRLHFEENGKYKYSFDYTAVVTGTASTASGWRFSIANSKYIQQIDTDTGVGSHSGTKAGTFTFDNATVHDNFGNGFENINKGEVRFRALSLADDSLFVSNGTLDNISIKANDDVNRITWGDSNGCTVVTGDSSQIIAYPRSSTGLKIDGVSTFELTADTYYTMRYDVSNTNYANQSSSSKCNIRLFDHDHVGKSSNQSGLQSNTSSNDGHVYLDVTNGTHEVTWLQSQAKNQLEILFESGFSGTINNVELYPLTVSNIDYGGSGSNSNRKVFNVEIVSIDNNIVQIPISEHKFWNCELVDKEPLFKKVFPRFAYRWKYDDGEYSAISAFTEVAFLPDEDYTYNSVDGYNLSMENTVRRVVLSKFDKMPTGVSEIEILYKESNSNNIYTFTTIKGAELEDFTKFEINKEKFHAVIDSKQILRPYDNIPRKAVAQEISSNRIIFGNYTQQYDISPSDEPSIVTSLSSKNIISAKEVGKSIKSIREYQVGISYLDLFGRQSPIFSVDTALISVDQRNSKTLNSILATLNTFPPEWVTHYKYFVKDSAASYYNISLDRFYQAENSSHAWLSFPSSDFNKIKEDDYLILKKEHNSTEAIAPEKTIKYKVLSKKGNAPNFIKMTRKNVGGRIFNSDGGGLHFASQTSYGGSAAGYPQKDKITFRLRGDIVHANAALQEACLDNQTGRYIRLGQLITGKPSLFSNYYEILHISRVNNSGSDSPIASYAGEEDYYEFTLVEALAFDASFVGSSYKDNRKLFLEYYREELNQYDNNFEGKFFVKIAKDSDFDKFVGSKQKIEDTGFNIVNAEDTYWSHVYESDAAKNTDTNIGQDTDRWLYDRVNNFDWKLSTNTTFSSIPSDSTYNGVTVKNFPGLMNDKVKISNSARTNPFIGTWAGTVHGKTKGVGSSLTNHPTDWGKEINGSLPQRFNIYQAFSWYRSSNIPAYTGQDTDAEDPRLGSGFVMGNNYCSFAFSGIGDVDMGSDDALGGTGASVTEPDPSTSPIDTNTWFDGGDGSVSSEFFDNFKLTSQLIRVGTQFRWADDPSNTIYTVKKVLDSRPIANFDAQDVAGNRYGKSVSSAGNYTLKKDKSVFSYRIDLELDRKIVWSPTATLASGFGYNADNSHATLVPFSSANEGTTSQIQILEKRPSEITDVSFNPAVFEVEPKERADLNLYYESAETSIVLKDGMHIEALNNIAVNDYNDPSNGGNYNSESDVDTIYKPGGKAALPYVKIFGNETISNSNFEESDTASSGVLDWVLDSATGFTSVQDSTNYTLTLTKTPASGVSPSLTSSVISVVSGEKYQLTVDVDSINNDVNNLSGAISNSLVQVAGWDGSAFTTYYPLSGSTPSINQGVNIFEFTHDSSIAGASNNQLKVSIILSDSTSAYTKEIVLKSVSLKTLTSDETRPIVKIQTGKQYDWCDNPNKIKIDTSLWNTQPLFSQLSIGEDLPSGITVRISQLDSIGNVDFYKDYILPASVVCGSGDVITLPPEQVKWHNCFSFGNGVESNRLRDDFNAVTIDKGPRVSTTLEESYKEQKRGDGLIFSGIYNSTSGVNQLNQFIAADKITKDLNPDYGSIQKLFTRNTNVVALCEDKILKILVDKDALFNADGSMQITASHKVLGQAIPFEGEYGISRNPESFANFGYRIYFTDRDRGAVLRLSNDGLTPISEHDMISYFKYKLPNSNTMIGSYDENRDLYNLTLEDITVSFSEAVTGWTSFKSFLPESGLSINGDYFTWKNGDIWKHHSNALRNNFYSRQYESSVKLVLNTSPDSIKNFNTLGYEGTSSRAYEKSVGEENQLTKKGWYANSILTDLQSARVVDFTEKEGKWFSNITGVAVTEENISPKNSTSQGLGFTSSVSSGDHINYKTLLINAVVPDSIPKVNSIGSKSGLFYVDASTNVNTYNWNSPIDYIYTEDVINSTTKIQVRSASIIDWESHTDSGSTLDPSFYYATGVISNLLPGNRYYLEAEIENFSGSGVSAGFSAANMTDVDVSKLTLQGNGKITAFFVYDNNKYDPSANIFGGGVEGIHFAKQAGSSGRIKNIRCVNVTAKKDNIRYVVNTSSTDKTQTISQIKTNEKVGINNSTITKYLYIHGQTVNGIKYSVNSGKFTATSSNPAITISSITNIGVGANSPGYYGNVIEITMNINYNSGNLFPNENVESYININGSANIAIDQ